MTGCPMAWKLNSHGRYNRKERTAMKASEAFPSKYLSSSDLGGKNARVIIADVQMEELQDRTGKKENKMILYFRGKTKGMVCNKTNGKALIAAFGDETDDWINNEVILFTVLTDVGGETKEGLRLRTPQPKDNPRPRVETAPQRMKEQAMPVETVGDDIPF